MVTRATVAAALALCLMACDFEDPISPGKKVVIVHAVLDAGSTSQVVLVAYSDVAGRGEPIAGAQVTITTPEGVQMAGTPDTATRTIYSNNGQYRTRLDTVAYRISLSAYGVSIVPGATYALHVHTPAGEDVTGTTTVPLASPVPIDATESVFVRLTDTLRISWTDVTGAGAYEIRTSYVSPNNSSTFFSSQYAAFTTNPVSLPGTLQDQNGSDVFRQKSHLAVMLSAVDANYYEYYRINSDPFVGAQPGHLTGGMGVFGSLVPIVSRRLDVR